MATAHEPRRVSAADFIRGFSNWRLQAAQAPVVVTHHGRDAHVLISLDAYHQLDRNDRQAATDPLSASLVALVETMRDGAILFDRDLRIVAANPTACDMIERAAAQLIGMDLTAALPGIASSLLLSHVARLVEHRERFAGDVPGLLRPRQWLRVDLIPVPAGGAMILRDISAAMDELSLGNARRAAVAAIDANGLIGRADLSVREAVEDANDTLAQMVGADAFAIRRVRFSALLPLAERNAFGEALEAVFRNGAVQTIDSALITREGERLPVRITIAERRNGYASDGAVVVVTPQRAG